MKFFPINPEVDHKTDLLLKKIRNLKNGETADLMRKSGALYKTNYGVSVVHLRKLAEEMAPDAEMARRLWHRQIRETMIVATLIGRFNDLGIQELEEWGSMLNTIELAEQLGRNLLNSPDVPATLLTEWLASGKFYKQYASAMAMGWRFRFYPENPQLNLESVLPELKKLSQQPAFSRAVGFVLKMAGRFCSQFQPLVMSAVDEWLQAEDPTLKQVAQDVKYELEALL